MPSAMNAENIKQLRRCLADWYAVNRRELPWRKTDNPYHIWISEVMLQQTQVNSVLPFYRNFLRHFPDVHTLASAHPQDVLKAWEGLGYYARARNLHRAAAVIQKDHGGRIPDRWQALRKLPGVGDYIAAALLSIAFGQAYPAVDGNVKRVLARLFKIDAPVNQSGSYKIFQKTAARLLDARRPGLFNQSLMELGAMICRPTQPACERCPLQPLCRAHRDRQVGVFPRRLKKPPVPLFHIAVGVVFKNRRVLITRRSTEGLLGGLWEFPGGKIKTGETAPAACIREIKEEVNLTVSIREHLARVKHAYSHFKIVMDVFCCDYVAGRVKLSGPAAFRWIRPAEIDRFPVPGANHKFIPKLKKI